MLLIILLLYCALAIGFGVVNPLFEAPDEHLHFLTARYIADTGKLPNVTDQRRLAGQEAAWRARRQASHHSTMFWEP
jgi:hypothetical protein